MSEQWLSSLVTQTPQEGFDLAVKLARMAVKLTQPSAEIRDALRGGYAHNAEDLIAVSHVVATHFQTVAAANGYWRKAGADLQARRPAAASTSAAGRAPLTPGPAI